jgi:hypothetical protein
MGKKLMILALAALVVGLMVPAMCGAADLIADGRDAPFDAGDVSFSFDGTNFVVQVTPAPPWCLKDVHIDVQTDPGDFPTVKKGNPKLQAFAYKEDFIFEGTACTSSVSQSFTGFSQDQTVYVAVHAAIVDKTAADTNDDGVVDVDVNSDGLFDANDYTYESAWIDGTSFGGKNWAMYLETTVPAP